eukprot:c14491_g1_i1.p1 GENE.c14491_g1_i1~~c14491_g1_i1.p1  ORF type:complete len:528 (-),score=127.92 c14491_g1_i1:74-1567(-)
MIIKQLSANQERSAVIRQLALALKKQWKDTVKAAPSADESPAVSATSGDEGGVRSKLITNLEVSLKCAGEDVARVLLLDCRSFFHSYAVILEKGKHVTEKHSYRWSLGLVIDHLEPSTFQHVLGDFTRFFVQEIRTKSPEIKTALSRLSHVFVVAKQPTTENIPVDQLQSNISQSVLSHLDLGYPITVDTVLLSQEEEFSLQFGPDSGYSAHVQYTAKKILFLTSKSRVLLDLEQQEDEAALAAKLDTVNLGDSLLFSREFVVLFRKLADVLEASDNGTSQKLRDSFNGAVSVQLLTKAFEENVLTDADEEEKRVIQIISKVIQRCGEGVVLTARDVDDAPTFWNEFISSKSIHSPPSARQLAEKIEQAVFDLDGEPSKRYKDKMRSVTYNLGPKGNADLRSQLFCGQVKPERIAQMTTVEMAAKALQQFRQQIREEATNKSIDAASDTSQLQTSDAFKCPSCGQRKCTYREMQTRSADEPMTVFITCVACGHNWKQ